MFNPIIMIFFSANNPQNAPHSSHVRVSYGVSFVSSNPEQHSSSVIAMLYVILFNIQPLYILRSFPESDHLGPDFYMFNFSKCGSSFVLWNKIALVFTYCLSLFPQILQNYWKHIALHCLTCYICLSFNTSSGGRFGNRYHQIFWKNITQYQQYKYTWWRHQMETFSALLALCAGNSPVSCEFPSQRPVMRSIDVFFQLCPNKRLSKQSWGWHFDVIVMKFSVTTVAADGLGYKVPGHLQA